MMHSLIVEALSDRTDVTLIGSIRSEHDPTDGQVDVVLTPTPDPEDVEALMALLWRWPQSRVVAVAGSGRLAVIYELHPRKTVLGDLCPATLVDAICQAR